MDNTVSKIKIKSCLINKVEYLPFCDHFGELLLLLLCLINVVLTLLSHLNYGCVLSFYHRMHSSAKFEDPPIFVVFLCSCDKVYHKQEECFLLYLLGQIVT